MRALAAALSFMGFSFGACLQQVPIHDLHGDFTVEGRQGMHCCVSLTGWLPLVEGRVGSGRGKNSLGLLLFTVVCNRAAVGSLDSTEPLTGSLAGRCSTPVIFCESQIALSAMRCWSLAEAASHSASGLAWLGECKMQAGE